MWTRMSGGVGGVPGNGHPYPISIAFQAHGHDQRFSEGCATVEAASKCD